MSDTLASLRRKIGSARDLKSVVRSMKALAGSNIGQYEKSVQALADYERSVELGLSVCLKQQPMIDRAPSPIRTRVVGAIVFGSDQGLVGQFNDVLTEFVVKALGELSGAKKVWAVGERIRARLADNGLTPLKLFTLPTSVKAIAPLVGDVLVESERYRSQGRIDELLVFHNRPLSRSVYEPTRQRLFPLDQFWARTLAQRPWPTANLPELLCDHEATLLAYVREYLFVSLFKACAESLAAENGSRLAAMQRAEKNIEDLVERLNQTFHRIRKSSIDEQLFDLISGYEAISLNKDR